MTSSPPSPFTVVTPRGARIVSPPGRPKIVSPTICGPSAQLGAALDGPARAALTTSTAPSVARQAKRPLHLGHILTSYPNRPPTTPLRRNGAAGAERGGGGG